METLTCVPHRDYQICTRCVMDTSDPWIRFDAEGICNHCTEFLERRLAVTSYGPATLIVWSLCFLVCGPLVLQMMHTMWLWV